jgi:membrane glycosyltransferase
MNIKTPPLPPIQRASMVPTPWAGHPFMRPFRRIFGAKRHEPWRSATDVRPLMLRRVLLLVLVVFGAGVGTDYMIDILPKHGDDWAEQGLLVLFGILFAWISAGFWTGLMGAWVMLRGHDGRAITNSLRSAACRSATRACRPCLQVCGPPLNRSGKPIRPNTSTSSC